MKRVLLILLGVVLLLVGGLAALVVPQFSGGKPSVDGAELPGGARLVKDGFVNAYLLPAGEKDFALVDCGADKDGKAIDAELARRGLGAEAVKAIFVTHGHGDHIGGCRLFPQAQVFVFPGDQGLVEGVEAAKGFVPTMAGPAKELATKVTRTLQDGETVTVGTLQVRAFSLPGHTAGSGAYLAGGVLYLGDSLAAKADGSVRIAPWFFSDDADQNVASVKALAARLQKEPGAVTALAFAHSGPDADPQPLWDFAK